jgi:NTE family protein
VHSAIAPTTPPARPTIGLVLTGGGARAAYQVGVLRAIADIIPAGSPSPFKVVCGTSAGAINAAAIAADATNFRRGVRRLVTVWKNFHAGHVYRSDLRGVLWCSARWIAAVLLGGLGKRNPISLLDNSPLASLLAKQLDFAAIRKSIDCGALSALAVTASGYTSGESISFFEGAPGIEAWRRSRRVGERTALGVSHLMASAAIPFMFPPVRLNREYFGDGSMRQIAPISPALHLGADRVMIVSVATAPGRKSSQAPTQGCPSLAQIAGHALNSIFLDALEADLERLERINRTVGHLQATGANASATALKRVEYIVLSPSQEIEQIALRHLRALPRTVRFFLRSIGAMRRSGSNLASYVLFERPFCRHLLRLGYEDTMARRDEVIAFLGSAATEAPPGNVTQLYADRAPPPLRMAV